jgi:Protein of unknown function (DUF2408)
MCKLLFILHIRSPCLAYLLSISDLTFFGIVSEHVNDKFVITSEDGTVEVPRSQAIYSSILEECFEIVGEVKVRSDEAEVSHVFKPIYDRL